MLLITFSLDTKIALFSSIAAILSALFALRSNFISRKALKITQMQYLDKMPDFDVYYNEGFRFIAKNKDVIKRLFLFHITIRNKSDSKNTLKSDLEIEYLRDDDSLGRLVIEHNPILHEFIEHKGLSIFPTDIELDGKTISTQWLIFEQPNYFENLHRIEKYQIKLTDLHNQKSFVEAVLIKNIEE